MVRGDGLEIVLLVLGTVLAARCMRWIGTRITAGIEERADEGDELVRSQAARHRHALAQVVSWTVLAWPVPDVLAGLSVIAERQ